MSIAIVCKDIDLNIRHSLIVTRSEAEDITQIDPTITGTLDLPSCGVRIETQPSGTSHVWVPGGIGRSHWSVRTHELIAASEAELEDC